MRMSTLFKASVCSTATALAIGQSLTPAIHLQPSTRIEVRTTLTSPFVGDAVSDTAGSVYTRLFEGANAGALDYDALPISEIASDGTLVRSFKVSQAFLDSEPSRQPGATSNHGIFGVATFVTSDGDVFELAGSHEGIFAVEFAQDGSFKSKVKLETESSMQPWRLAVFKSGQYLVSGTTGKDHLTPFTAVFSASGRLIKSIYESEDEEARLRSTPGDGGFHPWNVTYGRDFIYMGEVTIASDGNAYLLHGGNSIGLVYGISPQGEVLRKLRIDTEDSDMVTRSIRSYENHLAIEFEKHVGDSVQNLIKLTNLMGDPIADYSVDAVGRDLMFLAGYGPRGFVFKPAKDNDKKLYLITVKVP